MPMGKVNTQRIQSSATIVQLGWMREDVLLARVSMLKSTSARQLGTHRIATK